MNQQEDDAMGRVSVEVTLGNYEEIVLAQVGGRSGETVRQVQLLGIVDTGASRLVLPERVVQQLGLPSAGEVTVRYADQRTATRPLVKGVWLKLQGRESIFSAVVEPDREYLAGGRRRVDDPAARINGVRQRLLDQHMLAGLERRQHHFLVALDGR